MLRRFVKQIELVVIHSVLWLEDKGTEPCSKLPIFGLKLHYGLFFAARVTLAANHIVYTAYITIKICRYALNKIFFYIAFPDNNCVCKCKLIARLTVVWHP